MKKLILIFAVLLATSVAFAQNVPPAIFYSDLASGPNTGGQNSAGAFVTIHGKGFGASQGPSTVTIGGGAAASYQSWSDSTVTFQLGSAAKTGSIAINVGGVSSNSVPFSVRSGSIFFVSTSGNDRNAGSYRAPWKTLAHAVRAMSAGSITYVENGYTQSTELVLNRAGTASAPMAILGYPASSVTIGATTGLTTGVSITSSNWVLANLIFRGTQTALSIGNVTDIRLAGSDVSCPNGSGSSECISTNGGSSLAFLGNAIHDNGSATSTNQASYMAMYLVGTDGVEIGWNIIGNTLGCNAIGVNSTTALQYSYLIHDNYIYNTRCEAIALWTVDPSKGAVSIYNNIIQSSGTGPAPAGTPVYAYAAIVLGGGTSTPVQVYNNTIYDAGSFGGADTGAVRAFTAAKLTNNIFYLLSNEQYVSLDTDLGTLTGTNNLFYGAGSPLGIFSASVATSPEFVNLTANNFHLAAGSPAIDAGATVTLATDYDGVPRPQGSAYDIGAYEYPNGSQVSSQSTPVVSFSPTSLTFASQAVGTTSAAQTITLKNTGAGALSISGIAASGNFAETNTCGSSLAASASCTISVTFTPTAAGTPAGAITFTDTAAASPQQVSLSGTAGSAATAAVSLSPTSLTFASQTVATTSAAQTVTLKNTGTAALTISGIAASGNFAETNTCGSSLAASASCTISVTFTPTAAGTPTGAITFTDNAAASPQQVSLSGTAVAAATAAVSLSPTSLTFASQTVATTSAAQTVTVKNTGTAALTISGIAASGNFAETNTCGSSLAASASCTVSVTFTPTAAGTPTGAITFTDNAAASPQQVSLSGTAVAAATAAVSLSPTSLTFASQTVATTSAAQTVTVKNTGTAALTISGIAASGNFAETTACPSSLPAGASCTVSVTFTPTAVGTLTGAITFTDNAAASPQNIGISGTGTSGLTIATASLPAATVGTAYSTTLAAANGTAPYTWTWTSCSGACTGISLSSSGVLAGTPGNAGTATFTFTVTDSAGHTASTQLPMTIAAGATPTVSLSPTSLTFASQTVATTSAAQTVTLTNTGTAALTISGIAASGNFAETNTCGTSLAASASCTVSVTFTPTAAGTLTGSITFTDNAAASPQAVSLSGTAVAAVAKTPAVSLSPTSMTFASQTVATTSAAQTVTLTNTGAGALSISGIAASANFAETTACPSSLPAGASCTISVTFTPTAAGTPTGSITFTDNAAASPQAVSLSGTAVAAASTATPSVALSWTESSSSISGYNVYRSTTSGTGYTQVNSSLLTSPAYTDTSVSNGQTYYYVVTSVNTSNVQSAYSAQVTAVVPAS